MLFRKFDWLRHVSLVTSAWIVILLAQAPAPGADEDKASVAIRAETPATVDMATQDVSANQTSGQAAATADEPSDEPAATADEASNEPLEPIPASQDSGIVPVRAASFKGITPGVSTQKDTQEAWGPPKEISNQNAQLVHLYVVEPFDRVEVSFADGRVKAIVIRLDSAFPADTVAEQLKLSEVRPVLVSNELGQVLGESFPENGVLFAFEPSETPGTASMRVTQVVLEPISAEPFVLRAETNMSDRPDSSRADLEQAIKINPQSARAHWLKSRVLAAAGELETALEAASQAVQLKPVDSQYRLTRAQILGQLGRFATAVEEAEKSLNDTKRPHVRARALCLLGDLLSSQPQPDYRKAIEYHMDAAKAADPLAVSQHPAIRLAAKEVLIDSHLGAGHDIAWGPWEQKDVAVPRWLEQAEAVAKDLVHNEGGSAEHEFRVATRALAACVGMRGEMDPATWADNVLEVGQQLIASLPDSPRKEQIRWDLGMALYDIVQICQMRGEYQAALVYGKRAVGYLEPNVETESVSLADTYLLGRLYFRLGAIHAVGQEDHAAAIDWFDKAIPVFEKCVLHVAQTEFGRLGETFVSMGVSFWESQRRDRAVELTERGVELMEQAVRAGALEENALEIPYDNLATMARTMGNSEDAQRYLREANKRKPAATR